MLALRCFGEVTAVDPRGFEVSLRSRKHTGLLLYLVAHPRTVHVREELAYLLWDGPGQRARHSLSQALYDIRTSLGRLLAVDPHAIRLIPNRIVYELDAFERAFQDKDHERVIELYRGDFAPELNHLGAEGFDRWLDSERERCRVLVTLALRNAQRVAEASGDWDRACLAALRLVRQNEFDEEAHCALMRGLCMKGDAASALAHYRAVREAGWVGDALKLTELAEWAGGEQDAPHPAVREPMGPRLAGRDEEFRRLTGALQSTGPAPIRVALVGERGMGRDLVLRQFARVVQSAGGVVQWLAADAGESPADPGAALRRHAGRRRLIVLQASERDWRKLDAAVRAEDASRSLVIGLSDPRVAQWAEAARMVDFALTFEPLAREVCASLVREAEERCTPHQAAASAELSGGNPGLAHAIARTWIRHGHEPDAAARAIDAGRLAYERSAEVRSLVDHQLRTLSRGERRLVAVLSVLTPAARAHPESIIGAGAAPDDVAGLETKGWIRRARGVSALSRPLAGHVVAWGLDTDERARIHVAAATVLEKGGLDERSAAAREFAAAGHGSRAFRLACEVASDAMRAGRSPLAGRAGSLAFEHATCVADRLRSGLLLADAELQRGCHRRATAVLHQVAAIVEAGSDLGRVHLAAARAATASGDTFARDLQSRRLEEAREHATEAPLRHAIALQLQVLRAVGTRPGPRRAAAFETLRRMLLSLSADDALFAGTWCDAFRLVFSELARRGTRSEARLLLEKCRRRLGHLGYEGGRTSAAAEFWVAMRGARLRDALELLRAPAGPPEENRYGSASLNNHGAVLMELGDFDAGLERLDRCQALDRVLESSDADQACALLNQAQCAFFKGDLQRCRTYTRPLLRPDRDERDPLSPQAWALHGLLALAAQDQREVRASRERLDRCADAAGEDDAYLISWFLASAMGPGRREPAARHLFDAADRTAPIDRLSAGKLRVLAGTLSPSAAPTDQREARGLLRAAGASWFVRFATAWAQQRV